MENDKKLEHLGIIENTENNNQPSNAFIYSDHIQSQNPENLATKCQNDQCALVRQAGSFDQKMSNQVNANKFRVARGTDIYKTNQNSPKNQDSKLNTFSPECLQSSIQTFRYGSEQEDSENNYTELTLKLQKALNKISLSGKGLTKSSSQSDDIWKRSQICTERKNKELQRKRKESQIQKLRQIRQKPEINKNSLKIVQEAGHEPIHVRFQKIADQKKKRIQETEQGKKREKEQEERLFLEEFNRHMKRPNTTRTYTQYFSQMVRWKQKKEEVNKEKLQEEKRKELQRATFKPNLNPKSKEIVSEKKRLPIDQRGLVRKKTQPEFSFKPKISRKP